MKEITNSVTERGYSNMSKNQIILRITIIVAVISLFGYLLLDQSLNKKQFDESGKHFSILASDTLKLKQLFHLPDSIHYTFVNALSDTNFTYKKYIDFLNKISDTSKFIVLPLNEFRKTFNKNKIIIGLRHDVDLDMQAAIQLAKVENNYGFRSTYFILHTANYYLAKPEKMDTHSDSLIPKLKYLQNSLHHEIGWHNDLVTLQVVYKINPIPYLHHELLWLRENGLKIYGTSSHGSKSCYTYKYLNYYFFKEHNSRPVGDFSANKVARVEGKRFKLVSDSLSSYKLEYEAYFLNNNEYYSDATIKKGVRWNLSNFPVDQLKKGDRVIILTHPNYYWPKGQSLAEVYSIKISGQIASNVNPINKTITIQMPKHVNLNDLDAKIDISMGAIARIGDRIIQKNLKDFDFSRPLNIQVISENGLISKNWKVVISKI